MKEIIVHEMEYNGDIITSDIDLINYKDEYFKEYEEIYNECFSEMRRALEITPIDCCDTREKLIKKKDNIFLLIKKSIIIGSVGIYNNEIDDLIVSKKYQGLGYGKKLLHFAIAYMQKKGIKHITLHVADWNQKAMNLYKNNDFKCIKTEKVR